MHRQVLREYGVRVARMYRGYLAAAYTIDAFGRHRGNVTQATVPAVARDDDGNILDGRGSR